MFKVTCFMDLFDNCIFIWCFCLQKENWVNLRPNLKKENEVNVIPSTKNEWGGKIE